MAGRILLVEDDPQIGDYIARGLDEEGFTVDRATTGRDGLFLATDSQFDVVVLDRMLPGMDGLSVLKALRAAEVRTPVIILSALGSTDDRIAGLTAGADDYLGKPFSFAELLARVQALIRRGGGTAQKPAQETTLRCSDLELDRLTRQVRRGTRKIALQPREFRLLEYMLLHQGEVVTRTMLLEAVWDYHFDPGTNVIDVHISRLRRKIDDGEDQPLFHTVRGAGYRLALD
ncbi:MULTISPECIES: response regulator transcription factor [unclassified Novosphingobium]|uniref:response regulator transcription factor n=1 Tax=unclassified Novosphingobium TaxID=2644732 RepID=UPI00061BD5E1|nr:MULTISPECIES: response regulator transcription factor [unclassified Novosphingobium]MBF5090128.1 response regulator transcription factor [Novosphingobium sp. NBM11]QCI94294.1 response regulator transcription factor [Novosphingobium sp. EMRT-2]RQW45194.1 DNA-binding response regulator [Novosphingobium sp. LASN5T]GAO54093.1 response regulator in two-component regulatory system with phoQ [Novosphingobium sp. MD-1]